MKRSGWGAWVRAYRRVQGAALGQGTRWQDHGCVSERWELAPKYRNCFKGQGKLGKGGDWGGYIAYYVWGNFTLQAGWGKMRRATNNSCCTLNRNQVLDTSYCTELFHLKQTVNCADRRYHVTDCIVWGGRPGSPNELSNSSIAFSICRINFLGLPCSPIHMAPGKARGSPPSLV